MEKSFRLPNRLHAPQISKKVQEEKDFVLAGYFSPISIRLPQTDYGRNQKASYLTRRRM